MNTCRRPSFWFALIVTIAVLPAFLLPTFMMWGEQRSAPIDRLLFYGFPIYLAVSALLAWLCYSQRRVMAWILVAVMLLSDIAMGLLLML